MRTCFRHSIIHPSTMMVRPWTPAAVALLLCVSTATAFSTINHKNDKNHGMTRLNAQHSSSASMLASAALLLTLSTTTPLVAWADEYGVETEAPTFFTGETVMICKKRGPLGACLEQVERTAENDNDKASKYFQQPVVKPKLPETETNANELISKLKQQSEDNREKNLQTIKTQTAINDQSASFGPFDRSVIILNTDGKTFTVLENPQAMRLKKAGFIQDRRFVIQPTQQDLNDALENSGGGIGGFFKGLFGTTQEE